MKRRLLYIIGLMFWTWLSGIGWAIENTMGSATVPPSSIRSGLINTPNPIDTSGNLLITGNVVGDRHFRGVVPYSSTTDFRAVTPSSSFDSFLRRSAGTEEMNYYRGIYEPYYSPSRTVTTTSPGVSGVIRPPTTEYGSQNMKGYVLPPLSSGQVLPIRDRGILYTGFRPLSRSPQELEEIISDEADGRSQDMTLMTKQRQAQMERFGWDLKQAEQKESELKQDKTIRQDDSLKPFPKTEPDKGFPPRLETPLVEGQMLEDSQTDVYEQMKRQTSLPKFSEKLPATEKTEEAAADVNKDSIKQNIEGRSLRQDKSGLSGIDISAKARSILGPYKTFASYSEDKFNQHMRAAEDYLKQGKYYRAADVYTLAMLYKPDDPLAYAGKSHALFAAGEYMSSALFLSRAIEIFPEYAQVKIDIAAMIGDRDKVENRIVDIEQLLQKIDAAELRFLLGYVYYRLDRLERAKQAIDAAYEKMPDAPAVATLKKAIDDAIKLSAPKMEY